jgi:membrane-bound lytic murein transglycosylase A
VPAFLKSCVRILARGDGAPVDKTASRADFGRVADWRAPCRAAASLPPGDDAAARRFFDTDFVAVPVSGRGDRDGLFTGYFEIELQGSRRRHGPYQTPIYKKPPELGSRPFYTRAEIEDGALAGKRLELLWVSDPIDAFFLEIQGSGLVQLDDGETVRLGYDGQNGRKYVPVGRILIDEGVIPREEMTMARLRAWMQQNPDAGKALRRENPSYVFFRVLKGGGPLGSGGIELTPERSLAVDRSYIPLGVPIWLEADERFIPGLGVRHLVVAQDTGGAIKGPVRGDLFWGAGEAAAQRAGQMNARGRYWLLLPRSVVQRWPTPALAMD